MSVAEQVGYEGLDELSDLLVKIRKQRGIVAGATQPPNNDFGEFGQLYENLIFGDDYERSWREAPRFLERLIATAKEEILKPEKFWCPTPRIDPSGEQKN